MSHKFRMDAPFLDGLHYLSREEEATARRIALSRQNKFGVSEIDFREGDVEALAFVQRVRSEIDIWKNLEAVRLPLLISFMKCNLNNQTSLNPHISTSPRRETGLQ